MSFARRLLRGRAETDPDRTARLIAAHPGFGWPERLLESADPGSKVRATTLGTLTSGPLGLVDAAGTLYPAAAAWSIEWWVGAEDRWHRSPVELAVRQTRPSAAPVLHTAMRVPSGDVVHRCWAGGDGDLFVDITNETPLPVAVALVVRPVVPLGAGRIETVAVGEHDMMIDGARVLRWSLKPGGAIAGAGGVDIVDDLEGGAELSPTIAAEHAGDGMLTAAAVFPLAHTATLRASVRLEAEPMAPASVADAEQIASGWASHLNAEARLSFPDPQLGEAWSAALARLLMCVDERGNWPVPVGLDAGWGPDQRARIGEGLSIAGRPEASFALASILDEAPASAETLGLVAAVAEHAERSGDLRPVTDHLEWLVDAAATGVRRGVAGADRASAAMVRTLLLVEQPDASAELSEHRRRSTLNADEAQGLAHLPIGPDTERVLRAVLDAAGPTWSWAGGTPEDRSLDDPRAAAEVVALIASLAVRVDDQGIDIAPWFPSAWLGQPMEAHGIPTRYGAVSFGVRWHGERPALLWELAAVDGRTPQALTVRASALDPKWRSTELRGEALLEAPEGAADATISWPDASPGSPPSSLPIVPTAPLPTSSILPAPLTTPPEWSSPAADPAREDAPPPAAADDAPPADGGTFS